MKTIPQAEPFSLLLSLTLISIYGIFHAVHSILDTISDTFGSILDAFANAFCSVLDTFADTVRGIFDSISNAIGICCISASCVVIFGCHLCLFRSCCGVFTRLVRATSTHTDGKHHSSCCNGSGCFKFLHNKTLLI